MTEEREMEKLVSAIPGSFNTDWGVDVWNEVGKRKQNKSVDRGWALHAGLAELSEGTRYEYFDCPSHTISHRSHFSPNIQGDVVVQELSERVNRSLEICKNRGLI